MERSISYGLLILLANIICSCGHTDEYDSESFKKLISTRGHIVSDTISFENSEVFRISKDEGALGSSSYSIFHKKGSDKYHIINYSGQKWKNYILELCSYNGNVSNSGRVIQISRSLTNKGNQEIKFEYHPQVDSVIINNLAKEHKEGLYRISGDKVNYYGKLTDFCSLHDLDTGLYYLAPPSILYSKKTDIKELENKYK